MHSLPQQQQPPLYYNNYINDTNRQRMLSAGKGYDPRVNQSLNMGQYGAQDNLYN